MALLTKVLLAFSLSLVAVFDVVGSNLGKVAPPQSTTVSIRVSKGGWGNAQVQDIEEVLYSVAQEILAFVPSKRRTSIIVRHDEEGPMTLYKRGDNGEFIVLLDVENTRWAQYAYQFSHELCHVLAMNEKVTESPNQWFEESLGETASLFALRRMATTWKTSPPYPNWKDYAQHLSEYAEKNINEEHRQLPPRVTFVKWFSRNEPDLRSDPYIREKDEVIANQLLPLFEGSPQSWDAVTYLNLTKPKSSQTFEEYLRDWYLRSPSKHRGFIRQIADLFGAEVAFR